MTLEEYSKGRNGWSVAEPNIGDDGKVFARVYSGVSGGSWSEEWVDLSQVIECPENEEFYRLIDLDQEIRNSSPGSRYWVRQYQPTTRCLYWTHSTMGHTNVIRELPINASVWYPPKPLPVGKFKGRKRFKFNTDIWAWE